MKKPMNKQLAKHGKMVTKFLVSPFAVGLVVTAAVTYTSFLYYSNRFLVAMTDKDDHSLPALISQIHQKSIDWRLTDRGPLVGSDRVAILAIDDRSVTIEGRWPWSRGKQAKVVERALDYGAKSVSFDISYADADETSAIPALRKLKRGVASKSSAASEIIPLIDSELNEVDGDRAFAKLVKDKADQLILGTFFEGEDTGTAYRDFCLDAIFDNTIESRFWKTVQPRLKIIDHTLTDYNFPQGLSQGVKSYVLPLGVAAASNWFGEHEEVTPRITEQLTELGVLLPPESYPGISALWLSHDVENIKELLSQVNPGLASPEGIEKFYSQFAGGFTKKEIASLKDEIHKKQSKYCYAFLSPKDELLSLERYKQVWPDSETVQDQYAEQSLEKSWKESLAKNSGTGERVPANATSEAFSKEIDRLRSQALTSTVTNTDNWAVSIPEIAANMRHAGYFNAKLDSDGTIRRSRLFVRYGNTYMPSIAFNQFLNDHDYHAIVRIDRERRTDGPGSRKVVKDVEILDSKQQSIMHIPVDEYGHLMINYAGPNLMFPHISATDLLSDDSKMRVSMRVQDPKTGKWNSDEREVDKKEFLKDKLLIAGATAIGIFDLRVTPFEENYPGVETHANLLSNLTVEAARATGGRAPANAPGFMRIHPYEERSMWIILVILGVTLAALLSYFGSVAGLGITGAALGGIYYVDKHIFFNAGIVTTVLFPIFEVCASYVTLTFYKYFTEERKKRELKGTFEKYVSPAIVNEVLADPENIELGGKKMELTVMFSDVRGFTTISEKLDPRQLSDLLNSYLTPMTDLVFKNKGTLDKYMGDAIMAFWGAPIHFNDHAKHACRCALQMIEKLKQLQDEYRAKGLPEIDIGIGLNTGDMSVGNMGSETVRSYTVMGDSVNLGSRLEGINKEYGTRIIISEFTQKEVKDSFVTREVDWVRVKGKAQPVRIFELVAEGSVPPQTAQMLKHFEAGFRLYHERQFQEAIEAFNEALKINPDDSVSQLYVERCQDYLKEPPGENWDGVCTMTHK